MSKNLQSNGGKKNYFYSINKKRRKTAKLTPARIFFRRVGDWLERKTPTLVGVAISTAVVTLLAGIFAFALVILPDSTGITRVSVPDFTGVEYSDSIADDRLFEVIIEYRFDATTPAGTVLEQYPSAGSNRMVKKNERRCLLTLTLSRGTQTVILPDCTGITSAQAELELKALGLDVIIVEKESPSVTAGRVISSSPAPYTDVPTGNKVTIYVSVGNSSDVVTVPALTGLTESAAISRLSALGLLAGQTEYVRSDKPAGTVISQSAAFGSTATAGSKIYLTVSLG